MYLSGPPLHVLAMHLVQRWRHAFGDRTTVSFSAGIERTNYPDAVALGLVPVTACTDLLRTGGYARMEAYFRELGRRMDAVGAPSIDALVLRTAGQQDLSQAKLANTATYVESLVSDPRYTRAATDKPPKKVGSHLVLFDCLSCDKCVPVCPNDANFTYQLPPMQVPIQKATPGPAGTFDVRTEGTLTVEKKHQIANYADFCNECGNCDVFCPEDGGPYLIKPRFFGSREELEKHAHRDGFFVERTASGSPCSGASRARF
jgi:putative selenate reductase